MRVKNINYFTDNPVNQVMTYKELILKYELDTFLEAVEHYDDTAFKMMTPIVYFHQATRKNARSEEHTSELQSRGHLVCRLLLEKKNKQQQNHNLPDVASPASDAN